jgi:O-antigen ligase
MSTDRSRTLNARLSIATDSDRAASAIAPGGRFARSLNAIVFWGLLMIIAVAVFPYGTVDPWWESVFECSVFGLTILWSVESIVRRDWQIRDASLLFPVIAITAFAFLQAVQLPPKWLGFSGSQHMLSVDHYQTYLTARKTLALAVFFGLALAYVSTAKRLRWIVRAVIAVGLASAIFGILRQFLQTNEETGSFILPLLFYGTGYGQFISPNAFAYLMEMTLGLVAGIVLGGGIPRNRVLIYLAIMVIVWAALVLSNSRGGMLGLVCASVLLLFTALRWYSERRAARQNEPARWMVFLTTSKIVRIVIIVAMISILTAGVLWLGGDSLTNKIAANATLNSAKSDGATRGEIWKASWRLFKSNPWTGAGLGSYYLGITQFEIASGRIKLEQAHNDYLDLAASGGLVGLILGGWFLGSICWRARKHFNVRRNYQRSAALGAAAGMLSVAVHSFVDFGLQLTGIAVVFLSLAVILIANVPSENRERKRRRTLSTRSQGSPQRDDLS